jgi:diacylglycerol kinase (ATP)
MHLVVGTGGRAGHRDTVVEQVAQTAHRNGWTAELVALEALPSLVGSMERLVACGGDGLVHQCLRHLVGTDVELAVVPVGSGNDFARAFGIDHHNGVAIAAIAPDREDAVRVDVIQAGDRYAASVVTAGYSGRVNRTANGLRFPPGSAKYTVAALREIGRLSAVPTKLTLHGDPGDEPTVIEGDLTMFAIGNTAWFGGGMQICPTAEPTDGWLDVVALGEINRMSFVRWLPKVFKGAHTGHDAVQVGRARSVEVETDEPLWADGEPFATAPITCDVVPGAVRLMVP